ncbi:hypothetical protein PBS_51160 [Paraburkholderia sp. 2C]
MEICKSGSSGTQGFNQFTSCTLSRDGLINNGGVGLFANPQGWNASANDPASLIVSDKGFVQLDATDKIIVKQQMTMEGKKIFNLANGTADTDAVNVSQLKGVTTALGGGAEVNADGTVKAPSYNVAGSTYSDVGAALSAVDAKAATGAADGVKYDTSAHDKVTFNGATGTTLSNVKAGALSASSTDAVNGSQLFATNKRIDDINYNMGNIGDAVMYDSSAHDRLTLGGLAGGTMTAPVILSNVADGKSKYDAVNFGQLSALQGQVTNLDNRVTVVEGQVINMSGGGSWNNDAGGKKITNVAEGTETTDAVNVGQLNEAVANANSYTDARIGDLPSGMTSKDYIDQSMKSMQSQVNSVAKNSYGGIAAATALTMIPDVDQGKTIAVGVGTGNYKGYQAVALGASARITQNLKVKLGAGMSPGNGTAIGAGASYQW